MLSRASNTYFKSAEPFLLWGVPTAMIITSDSLIDEAISELKNKRSLLTFFLIRSNKPGS